MAIIFDIGDTVWAEARFLDDAGRPVDPEAIRFSVRLPSLDVDGPIEHPHERIERLTTGVFLFRIDPPTVGTYTVQCLGVTLLGAFVETQRFVIQESFF